MTAIRSGATGPPSAHAALAHPARQQRSQRTQDRGLEAATVPAIAERAGVSVGSIYRRFPDKDAVLRAVITRFMTRVSGNNAKALDPARWTRTPADVIGRIFVSSSARSYRRHAGLLKALEEFARGYADPVFRAQIDDFNLDTMRRASELLAAHRAEMDHPDPPAGARFAMLAIVAVLRFLMLSEGLAAKMLKLNDQQIEDELHRLFDRHLGIEPLEDGARLASEQSKRLLQELTDEARAAGEGFTPPMRVDETRATPTRRRPAAGPKPKTTRARRVRGTKGAGRR